EDDSGASKARPKAGPYRLRLDEKPINVSTKNAGYVLRCTIESPTGVGVHRLLFVGGPTSGRCRPKACRKLKRASVHAVRGAHPTRSRAAQRLQHGAPRSLPKADESLPSPDARRHAESL